MTQTLFFRHAFLPTGWAADVRVGIVDGLISTITPGAVPSGEETHAIALPGMNNLHSHTFQRAIAGLTEKRGDTADSFWSWRALMYRFALSMTPEDVAAVAAMAFVDMLEGGFTSVAEFHYLHHAPDGTPYADIGEMAAQITQAAQATGIDLLLLPVFYAHAGFGGLPPGDGQRRFINNLDNFARLVERCRALAPTGIAPHSLRAVTPTELSAVVALAGDAPLHIHIAEQTQEVADCVAWSGTTPVDWLLRHESVGPNWCLIHATHITPKESAEISKSGAVVGLCPITEANLGDGIFPAARFAGAFGIGSDSNVLIDAAQELRQLEYSQRLRLRARNVLATATTRATATALYQRSLKGGAQAMAQSAGLQPGAPANIVTLAASGDPDRALSRAVFAARMPMIDTVWVRGRKCVMDGRHAAADLVRARFNAVLGRLL